MSRMSRPVAVFLVFFLVGLAIVPTAQETLSAQVLRLLDRVNTWSTAQTFAEDPIFSEVHTAAPGSTDCDAAGELGKWYWDSTNDLLYLCSGASGWRKIVTTTP